LRIRARIVAHKPSHPGHGAVRARAAGIAQQETQVPGIEEIMQVLPHRYPFLLVDRVLEIEPHKRIVGIKNVTNNEPFFQGIFPDIPSCGRAHRRGNGAGGRLLLMGEVPDPASKVVYFTSLTNGEVAQAGEAGRPDPASRLEFAPGSRSDVFA